MKKRQFNAQNRSPASIRNLSAEYFVRLAATDYQIFADALRLKNTSFYNTLHQRSLITCLYISHHRRRHAHELTTVTAFTHRHSERRLHDDLTRRTRDGDDVLVHRRSALIISKPGRRTLIRVRSRGRLRRSSCILHRKREYGLTPTADGGRVRSIRTR